MSTAGPRDDGSDAETAVATSGDERSDTGGTDAADRGELPEDAAAGGLGATGSGGGSDRGHHLPAGAHVGDRRGLTAFGAVALALALGVAGGTVDVLTGPGLRTVFGVCFVLGCGLAALLVHREDLRAAVVMPPLVYSALALLGGVAERRGEPGSFLNRQALELVDALVVQFPVLLSATALAAVVAVARAVAARRRDAASPA